jgi:hypothetical protein
VLHLDGMPADVDGAQESDVTFHKQDFPLRPGMFIPLNHR